MAEKQKFRAVVETDRASKQGGCWVTVPFDAPDVFGTKARVPVYVTINKQPYRGSIVPMGGRHFLGVPKALRVAAKIEAGDTVEVVMERDTKPRVVVPPPDMVRALEASKAAQAAWDRLSYTHRKEHVRAIEEAKRPETRQRRIEKAVEMLVATPPARVRATGRPGT
jgi:hypothetical protein